MSNGTNLSLSIIIPAYNEAQVISSSCARLREVCAQMLKSSSIDSVELIFVDDGSSDGTAHQILQYREKQQDPHLSIEVIQFSKNFGHSAAVFAGLKQSNGALVAIIDADLQDPLKFSQR